MITLAESGFAPPTLPRADLSMPAARAVSTAQNLHYQMALAVQEHRCARLREANALMAMAAVQAQAEVAAAEQARLIDDLTCRVPGPASSTWSAPSSI